MVYVRLPSPIWMQKDSDQVQYRNTWLKLKVQKINFQSQSWNKKSFIKLKS